MLLRLFLLTFSLITQSYYGDNINYNKTIKAVEPNTQGCAPNISAAQVRTR